MTDEKRREKPLKEKRYLYYIYNNLYVHVRDSVDDFDDFDDHKPTFVANGAKGAKGATCFFY